ncbi:hypothetical protein DC498_03580 [Terrimonas sp.]|nr:hypothetical protein DC498_03580 [Terrimonas sp.]
MIFAFLLQSTSQLWIMLSFKINQDYIAANLCINRFEAIPVCKGSCYLENQLNQDQKQQQKFPDLKTKEINLFCQDNSTELQKPVIFLSSNISHPYLNTSFITSDYLRSVFRPPSPIV